MTTTAPLKHIEILLVEDSPADVMITREAFKEAKLLNHCMWWRME